MKRAMIFNRSSKQIRNRKMKQTSPPTDATTILDLNDDCLFEVYKHLDLLNLTAVADVCSGLRRSARAYFELSKYRNLTFPLLIENERRRQITVDLLIFEATKVLRNFGAFITGFDSMDWWYRPPGLNNQSYKTYRREFVELLAMNCGKNLIDLKFYDFDLTNELTVRPLFEYAQKLELHSCKCSYQIVKNLSWWCPQLRELKFRFMDLTSNRLNQRFQKLTKISLEMCTLSTNDIREFLKRNTQLKEFEIFRGDIADARIFQYIGETETNNIEALTVAFDRQLEPTPHTSNAKYMTRLTKLKSMSLIDMNDNNHGQIFLAIRDIVAAKIPLETLFVQLRQTSGLSQLVDEISKLKNLKTLDLRFSEGGRIQHISQICEQLGELSKLVYYNNIMSSAEEIVELVQVANQLQSLTICSGQYICKKVCIDVNGYNKMAKAVATRANKLHLKIFLDDHSYSVNLPDELVTIHDGFDGKYYRFEY